jgi:MFS family permease
VVLLLALAVFINYVDRGNLPTAAPIIKDELRLTGTQIGWLLSAFFWTYMPCQILAGWLAERFDAYRTLAVGLAIWSIAMAFSGIATGFWALIALRLVLGVGEAAAFPCSSKLLAQHLPEHRLGSANGAIGVGLALGPAFGTFAGGHLMALIGWRWVFLLSGLVSLLWLWPWLAVTAPMSRAPAEAMRDERPPSFFTILRRIEIWGAGLGHFSGNYAFYFVITWLPFYLVKARGFSVPEMATLAGAIYCVYAAVSSAAGWMSDRWMQTGANANLVRKTFVIASHLGAASAMLGCALGNAEISIASLFLAACSFGLNTPSIFTIGQTLSGPRAAGKWISLQNCMGNVAGLIAPTITGIVVDRTGSFTWAFVLAFAMALLGVIGWGFMIRNVAPLDWTKA